jgi:phosphate transport system substrate-binding protein
MIALQADQMIVKLVRFDFPIPKRSIIRRRFLILASSLLSCVSLLQPQPVWTQQRVVLAGSGSTLEGSLFVAWSQEFNRRDPTIQVGYITTSSREGIHRIGLLLGDFATGEIRLSEQEKTQAHTRLVQIPIALMSVVPIYNLPGVKQLRFTGQILGQIYMGAISKWDDTRIARVNPGVALPDLPIVLVGRQSGAGTRYIFEEFLSRSGSEFRSWNSNAHNEPLNLTAVESGKAVCEKVRFTPGAIGYVELGIAHLRGSSYGIVRNSAGNFVQAGRASIYAASAARVRMLSNLDVSLVDAPGADSYPIVGFVWVYLPVRGVGHERSQALRNFFDWVLSDGQALIGQTLLPLPTDMAVRAREEVDATLR